MLWYIVRLVWPVARVDHVIKHLNKANRKLTKVYANHARIQEVLHHKAALMEHKSSLAKAESDRAKRVQERLAALLE